MNLKFIVTFIVFLLYTILSILIYRKNKKSAINITYSLMCFSAGLWSLSMAALLINKDIYLYENYIVKAIYFFGVMPPLFYLLFSYYFPYKLKTYPSLLIRIIYTIPIILSLLILVGVLKMETPKIVNNSIYQQINFFEFLIFTLYFFIYVVWGGVNLIKKYFTLTGIYKIQLKYLIIGTFSTFVTVGTVSVALPLTYNYKYDWLGPIFSIIHLLIIGYLIFYKSRRI